MAHLLIPEGMRKAFPAKDEPSSERGQGSTREVPNAAIEVLTYVRKSVLISSESRATITSIAVANLISFAPGGHRMNCWTARQLGGF